MREELTMLIIGIKRAPSGFFSATISLIIVSLIVYLLPDYQEVPNVPDLLMA